MCDAHLRARYSRALADLVAESKRRQDAEDREERLQAELQRCDEDRDRLLQVVERLHAELTEMRRALHTEMAERQRLSGDVREVERLRARVAELEAAHRWRRVEDEAPPSYPEASTSECYFLVRHADGSVMQAWSLEGQICREGTNQPMRRQPPWWMPYSALPAPPTASVEGQEGARET